MTYYADKNLNQKKKPWNFKKRAEKPCKLARLNILRSSFFSNFHDPKIWWILLPSYFIFYLLIPRREVKIVFFSAIHFQFSKKQIGNQRQRAFKSPFVEVVYRTGRGVYLERGTVINV